MRIDILLFGPQAELAGTDRIPLDLSESATVSDAITRLGQAVPTLASTLEVSRLAVNHDYAAPTDTLSEGDEVALIGMVSGG